MQIHKPIFFLVFISVIKKIYRHFIKLYSDEMTSLFIISLIAWHSITSVVHLVESVSSSVCLWSQGCTYELHQGAYEDNLAEVANWLLIIEIVLLLENIPLAYETCEFTWYIKQMTAPRGSQSCCYYLWSSLDSRLSIHAQYQCQRLMQFFCLIMTFNTVCDWVDI